MARIDRPTKSGGNRQYQQEVAAGYIDILDAEVDGDLDTIYALVNGNLDNYNISNTAAIEYRKLNLTGSIKGSDIAAGANIPGTAIQPGTIPASAIAANSITSAQILDGTITKADLAIAATVQDIRRVELTALTLPAANSWQLVGQVTWTARGGLGWIAAVVHCLIGADGSPPTTGVQADMKVDNVNVDSIVVDELATSGPAIAAPVTLGLQSLAWSTAGAHTITLYVTLLNKAVAYNRVKGGYLSVVEWA